MSKTELEIFDITFIGAGPTGLFGAFYAGLRELRSKVIDVLPQPGGQLTTLYPEKMIYDTPGFPAIRAKDLVANLVEQTMQWGPVLALGERAENLRSEPRPGGEVGEICWVIETDRGLHYSRTVVIAAEVGEICWVIETDRGLHYSRTVVIAAGIGAFEPRRLPNESVDWFEGKGVEYLLQDVDAYADMRVLIVGGGGDSAVDWALALEPSSASSMRSASSREKDTYSAL